jgi:hypothetical protein
MIARLQPFLIALLGIAICGVRVWAGSNSAGASIAGHATHQILPSDGELVTRAIVTASIAPASDQHIDAVMDLMLLFDHRNDPADLRQFARLGDLYLGEWPGELYFCVAMRKGRRLLPFLSDALRSSNSDCLARLQRDFGVKTSFGRTGEHGLHLCLPASEREQRLKYLIEQIKSGTGCSDEELSNIL